MTTPTTVNVRLQLRADTAANWTAANPVLLANEVGLETDTKKVKVGDGTTAWNSLAYFPSIVSGGTVLGNLEIGTTGTLTFEGSTADGFETTLGVINPTADRTINLPNQSGTVVVTGNASIVDADIAANAEIAVSKLANGTANQVIVTDGTNVSWSDDLTLAGNLTVNGTTTTVNTETLTVKDKNIELAVVDTPTDTTADGGGITLKGATDKTITWSNTTDAWTSNQVVDVPAGSAATPSLIFGADVNTGIYSPGADQVAISTGGAGRLFVGSTGSARLLGASSGQEILHIDNTAAYPATSAIRYTVASNSNWADVNHYAQSHRWYANGNTSEALRITSDGKLGLGVSSPAARFHLRYDAPAGENYRTRSIIQTSDARLILGTYWEAGVNSYSYIQATNDAETSTVEKLLLNPSGGNVGIGTSAPGAKLEVYGSARLGGDNTTALPASSAGGGVHISWNRSAGLAETNFYNIYDNALNSFEFLQKTGASTASTLYNMGTSGHVWYVSNSEKARIDSSGRLLVGTSSSTGTSTLQVQGITGVDARGAIQLNYNGTPSGSVTMSEVRFGDSSGNQGAVIALQSESTWASGDYPSRLVFSTTADGASSPTPRMTINNQGTVSMGGTLFVGDYLVRTYAGNLNNGQNLIITFSGASNSHRGQNIFQITYCNHTNNSTTLYAASFIVNIKDSATTGYSLSLTDFQSIYNVGSTVGSTADLTFVDNNDGTATLALPNKVGAGGNSGNTTARVTIQRLCGGYSSLMYPSGAVVA